MAATTSSGGGGPGGKIICDSNSYIDVLSVEIHQIFCSG
jgi:hypothetical protein